MPNYFYLDLVIRLDIMLSDFSEKKETCLEHKKTEFFKLQKIRFSKGLNPCFWSKNANFSLFRFCQNKTRNNVNYFEKKKDTLFDYKKQNFSKSKKSHICQRGYSMLLARKCHFFSFFRFDQNKTRNKTSEFAMKKETFFDLENRKSPKNRKVRKTEKSKKSHFFPNGLI